MSVHGKIRTLLRFLTIADYRFCVMADQGWMGHVPAEEFVRRTYRWHLKKELNLESPAAYTEKLQWLKLYDHRPEYTKMVDKYEAKQYVAQRIGSEYVIPLLGVWECAEDINFDSLPEKFVLKTTHDSGGIVICKNKQELNIAAARKKLRHFLKREYYRYNREWPYLHVKHRIIAEQYMEDQHHGELRDYKFFTFGGEPKVLFIVQGRGEGQRIYADCFDMAFNHLPFSINHPMAPVPPERPACFEEMKRLAALLSEGTPQLRVDFYEADGRVYFGEMTFFHCSGLAGFHPAKWDQIFGDWVTLPDKRL